MKPTKKLYRVTLLSIEEGVEFRNFDSKNVIATDAANAISRIRISKTKTKQTFIQSVELISEIDKV